MAFDVTHTHVASSVNKVGMDDWNDTHTLGSGSLSMRPALVAGYMAAKTKPTPVAVGSHAGYSLPVYASDDEELFFSDYIPGRWNGASDFTVSVLCCLAAAEDVGDKFKLQVSWENKATGSGAISASTTDVPVETTVATSRNAQYSIYKVDFTVDWDLPATDIATSDHIGFRLRRIAASSLECTGEIIVLDTIVTYTVDKIFKA